MNIGIIAINISNEIYELIKYLNSKEHDVSLFSKEDSKIPKIGRLIVCKNEEIILSQYSYLFGFINIFFDFSELKQVHEYCQSKGAKSITFNTLNINSIKTICNKILNDESDEKCIN